MSQTRALVILRTEQVTQSLPANLYVGLLVIKLFTLLTNKKKYFQDQIFFFIPLLLYKNIKKKSRYIKSSILLAHTKLLFIPGECTVSLCKIILSL